MRPDPRGSALSLGEGRPESRPVRISYICSVLYCKCFLGDGQGLIYLRCPDEDAVKELIDGTIGKRQGYLLANIIADSGVDTRRGGHGR